MASTILNRGLLKRNCIFIFRTLSEEKRQKSEELSRKKEQKRELETCLRQKNVSN